MENITKHSVKPVYMISEKNWFILVFSLFFPLCFKIEPKPFFRVLHTFNMPVIPQTKHHLPPFKPSHIRPFSHHCLTPFHSKSLPINWMVTATSSGTNLWRCLFVESENLVILLELFLNLLLLMNHYPLGRPRMLWWWLGSSTHGLWHWSDVFISSYG